MSLKNENELLNQDNRTLEEELAVARAEREKVELELEEMRRIRRDLDAKNVFLHFTQEQLNSQVVSLESVVRTLKTENHLTNKGLRSQVEQLQAERRRTEELRARQVELEEQYAVDNAETQADFSLLESQLDRTKQEAKTKEIELRSQLGEMEVAKNHLKEQIASLEIIQSEIKKDLEVAENDNTVLKKSFDEVDKAKNGIELDLAEVSKKRMEIESTMESLSKSNEELSTELQEALMSNAGLEGEASALREELEQLKLSSNAMEMKVDTAETDKEVLETELLEIKMAKEELENRLLDTQVRFKKYWLCFYFFITKWLLAGLGRGYGDQISGCGRQTSGGSYRAGGKASPSGETVGGCERRAGQSPGDQHISLRPGRNS